MITYNALISVCEKCRQLDAAMDLFEEMKDPRLVALSYNAGPGNVSRGYYVERYWIKIRRHYRKARTEQEIAFSQISEEQKLAYLQKGPASENSVD